MSWLGIDIGTSGVETSLMSETQDILASATASLDVSRPHPDWSEQDPHHWWVAVQSTLDDLSKSHAQLMKNVRGIGLSGHMHGATLIDKSDQVLRP